MELRHQRWVAHVAWEAGADISDTEIEWAIVSALENIAELRHFELELDDEYNTGQPALGGD